MNNHRYHNVLRSEKAFYNENLVFVVKLWSKTVIVFEEPT